MNAPVLEKLASSVAAETAIGFTQDMVRIDSTNGKEDALARQLEARLNSLRIGKVWCEKTYEGRLNTLWEVDSGKPGPRLLFTGHLDTKPVCEGWQRDPFDGAIENGRLYGHGVMDMKAGLGSLIGGIMTLVESGDGFQGQAHLRRGRRPHGPADRQHRSIPAAQVRPLRARRADRHANLHRSSRPVLFRHLDHRPLRSHLPQVPGDQCDREDAAGDRGALED